MAEGSNFAKADRVINASRLFEFREYFAAFPDAFVSDGISHHAALSHSKELRIWRLGCVFILERGLDENRTR